MNYLRGKNNLYLLLASCLFVSSTAIRLQGVVSFPIEIAIVIGFFAFHMIQKKYTSNFHPRNGSILPRIKNDTKQIIKIFIIFKINFSFLLIILIILNSIIS